MELEKYKQSIAKLYTDRSQNYDRSDWHLRIAKQLIEYGRVEPGDRVLDLATGTGNAAIAAARLVGAEGRVIGVDISEGMIDRAREKVDRLGLDNIEFQLADAEKLNFPVNSFDRVFCSSAFIWMSDLQSVLKLWYQYLKPGGIIGIHAFAETAFIGGVITQKIAQKYGISFWMSQPTGTIEKCENLFQQAGFKAIDIKVELDGDYITLEQAKKMWAGATHPAPGQYPPPLSQLSTSQLAQAQAEFEAELIALQTDRGIWNDITTFYIYAQK